MVGLTQGEAVELLPWPDLGVPAPIGASWIDLEGFEFSCRWIGLDATNFVLGLDWIGIFFVGFQYLNFRCPSIPRITFGTPHLRRPFRHPMDPWIGHFSGNHALEK